MGRIYLVLLFGLFFLPFIQSDVISCGGFVKSSSPEVNSKVKIKLENAEGVVKYETDLNPSNGYYMVPVYSKGSYIVRIEGPEGVVFNPTNIPLTIDGKTDPCSKNEDVNFALFGFRVNGKVKSGDVAGPSRLNLALFSEDNKLYAKTTTDETGAYSFDASPGKYVVSTIDNTQQCVERGSVSVEVKDKPVVVMPDIRISGHSLTVSVVDDSNSPLNGATVLLVSDQEIPFDQQINTAKPSATKKGSKWEYRLLTDMHGKVVFACLPPNKYELSASWSTKKTSLSFSPSKESVVIASEGVEIKFKTEGFDVVGQVQLSQKPIADVSIFVDGKLATQTDQGGNYKIKALKSGQHNFEAKKEHYYFQKLSHIITIENPTLPVIQAEKLEICGVVKFDHPESQSNQAVLINILDSSGNSVEKLHVGKGGRFCTFLKQGSYKFEPLKGESQLKPDFIQIEVKDQPILDLIFTEFKATINGQVKCFSQEECFDAKVYLISNNKEIDSTDLQDDKFTFTDVLPGNYKIHLAGLDSICLDEEKKSITVESSNLNVVFKQIGYRASVYSPITAKLNWKHGSEGGHIDLNADDNVFCLPKAGKYTFNFDSCHEFSQGSTVTHNLPTSEKLSLTVKSSHFSSSISTDINAFPNDFKLLLRSSLGESVITPEQKQQSTLFSFSTRIDQELTGKEIELIPKSEKFLFTPPKRSFIFDGECSFNKLNFKASEGKFVTGSIEPAVEHVLVTVKHKSDSSVLKGKTDSKGKYKIGLVFDPTDYEVDFELEGYKFMPTNTKDKFKSIKLSKLTISYADKATKKELADVLISLSGGDNYRENKIVNKDGKITFVGLPAGEYFIRSVLREYQFDPSTTSVKISEGETIDLKLFGNRHAWSAFGKVSTAGGKGFPSSQINVEAVSQNCGKLQEEDPTDDKGNFRIRGLKPKCTYRLSLRSNNGDHISSIPPFIDIETHERDTTDLEFTILATVPVNEIIGLVKFVDVPRPKNIRVELYENGVFKTHEDLSTNDVFIFSNMITPSNTYKLAINDGDLKNLNAISKPVEFVATQLTKNVILHINIKETRPEMETSKSNIFGVIFVLISAFIAINVNYSKDLLLTLIDHTKSAIQQRHPSPGAQDKRKQKRN